MNKLHQIQDEQLVELFIKGSNGAVSELLFRHKDRLYRYVFSLVHSKELTEDFFQDTFIKAITMIKQGKYSHQGFFFTWLSTIAHNLVIDYFRKVKNENAISHDEVEYDLFSSVALAEINVQDSIIQKNTNEEIAYLVSLLPDDQKEIIDLRFFQDLSFKEIAVTLNVSINTALGRIRYAILNLRKLAKTHQLLDYQLQ
ncbi:MAG: RNA polymerase sigma factor [Prevotellaceae bacterium]|jgi:RNA polymerase sigma-70 factor (ECF subfamily)|nr:RNA polymerase sigma factor [Prevotellaceae bacterium]